jgi:hypothetical protein
MEDIHRTWAKLNSSNTSWQRHENITSAENKGKYIEIYL